MDRAFEQLVRQRAGHRCEHCHMAVGKTPAGRASIATLRINLDHRVAYRRELIDEGLFPGAF